MMEHGSEELNTDSSGFRPSPGLIGFGIFAVVLLVFVFQNQESTSIDFLVVTAKAPLWVALLIAVLAGVILGELGGWVIKRRRNRST